MQTAPFPIVSFGQGCEGEPLLMWETISTAIKEIRKHTARGSLNINTNGSNPNAVRALCEAGLNSIRVSMNSARKHIYESYYRPNNYSFEDIVESLKVMRSYGGWASINYFVFPGMTDSVEEYEALRKLIRETGLTMIQWRNFNIDPDWYSGKNWRHGYWRMHGREPTDGPDPVKNFRVEISAISIRRSNASGEILRWILHISDQAFLTLSVKNHFCPFMKRIIIIGASSGIGQALARIYARKGDMVGITGRRNALLESLQKEFPENIKTSCFDVTGNENIKMLQTLIHELGGMDLLIYNAGYGEPGRVLDWKIEKATVDTNVAGFLEIIHFGFNYFIGPGSWAAGDNFFHCIQKRKRLCSFL